ncbi:uncharacterized protein LOC131641223 [Vicia villosa]|uniref:uncharacterized protein LOC131641223 n=1 Tax=Vicia villosa TaxID=3911 RepID=UPI00273C7787|nr:uncharacterized protein LOC131641223 [Vicia villosa]
MRFRGTSPIFHNITILRSIPLFHQVLTLRKNMAGGNFMHRVISYFVNEVVVNGLANSPAFQRFAVRTSKNIEDISKKAIQKRQELAEQLKDLPQKMDSFKNR